MCSWCKQQFHLMYHKAMLSGTNSTFVVRVVLVTKRVCFDVIRSRTCRKAMNALKVTNATETFRNVEDGMWRWTYSTDVVCSASSCNGLIERGCESVK